MFLPTIDVGKVLKNVHWNFHSSLNRCNFRSFIYKNIKLNYICILFISYKLLYILLKRCHLSQIQETIQRSFKRNSNVTILFILKHKRCHNVQTCITNLIKEFDKILL